MNITSVGGYHIREAGATREEDLAYSMAILIAYLQEGLNAGLDVDAFAPRFTVNSFGGSMDFLTAYGQSPVEPTGGLILFAGNLSYNYGDCGIIYYQWGIKSGSGEIIPHTEGRISDLCSDYRPDVGGGQVAFMRKQGGQLFDIWRNQIGVNIERLAVNLTPDTPNTNEILPVFSPDGQWIAFASDRGGEWNIYVIKSDGSSEPITLLDIPTGTDFSDWNYSRLSWAD